HVHAVVGHEEAGNADPARALGVPTIGDTVAGVDRAHAGTLDGASGSGVEDLAVVHPALVSTEVDGAGGDRHCGEAVAARSADPHRVGIGVVGFGRPAGGRITQAVGEAGTGGDGDEVAAVGRELDVAHVGPEVGAAGRGVAVGLPGAQAAVG